MPLSGLSIESDLRSLADMKDVLDDLQNIGARTNHNEIVAKAYRHASFEAKRRIRELLTTDLESEVAAADKSVAKQLLSPTSAGGRETQ